MAVEVGRGYVDIVPDLKGFQDKVGREVEQAASKASARAEKAINVGTKLTAGVTVPIVAGLGAATKAASDLEQSVGAVESVFGDASGTIFEFGETSADSFGLAREEVNRLGAVVGAQLQGLGFEAEDAAEETVKLQQRAADMAATFGGDVSQSVEAISALLRGERDTIEKYGVSLKQADIDARIMALGLDTSTVAAEKQATAIASLDLLYEQTADTAGQFAREQDTAAGQTERARAKFKDAAAELGTELLPIMAQGADVAGDLVSAFGALPDSVQTGVIALAGVGAAIGPISVAAGGAIKGIQGIKRATQALKTARAAATVTNVAEGYSAIGASAADAIPSLKGMRRGLLRGAGALAAFAAAGNALEQAFESDAAAQLAGISEEFRTFAETGESTGDLAHALGDDMRYFGTNLDRITAPGALERLSDFSSGFTDLLGFDLDTSLEDARLVMSNLDQELADLVSSGNADLAAQGFERLAEMAAEQGVSVEKLKELFPGYIESLDDAAVAALDSAGATEDETEATEANRDAHEAQKQAIEQAKKAHEEYTDQLRAAVDPVFALNDAFQGVEDAQEAYTEAVKEHGKESAEAEQAAFDLAQATADLEQAAIDGDLSFGAFDRKLADWVAQGKITAAQADTMRGRVRELRGEAEDYEGEYTAWLEANTGGASARVEALRQQILDLIRGNYVVTIDQQWGFTVRPPGSTGGSIPAGRAHGGPVAAGETYWVGEEGPELFRPDAAGEIIPHAESMSMAGTDRKLLQDLATRPILVTLPDGRVLAEVTRREQELHHARNGA